MVFKKRKTSFLIKNYGFLGNIKMCDKHQKVFSKSKGKSKEKGIMKYRNVVENTTKK